MIMKKNTERETEQISAWIRERKWEHTSISIPHKMLSSKTKLVKMMNKYQMYPNSYLWFKESNEQSKATLHIEDLYTI